MFTFLCSFISNPEYLQTTSLLFVLSAQTLSIYNPIQRVDQKLLWNWSGGKDTAGGGGTAAMLTVKRREREREKRGGSGSGGRVVVQ